MFVVCLYSTGDIGGSMGLLIGASIISLFEALDFLATTWPAGDTGRHLDD